MYIYFTKKLKILFNKRIIKKYKLTLAITYEILHSRNIILS